MGKHAVHYSSASHTWQTPGWLLELAEKAMGRAIELDPATSPGNPTGAARYFTEADNGLAQPWESRAGWLNPPYGRELSAWMRKLRASPRFFGLVLLPARTDTAWFHDAIAWAELGCFLRGRVRFQGGQHCAPFPSVILARGFRDSFRRVFAQDGIIVEFRKGVDGTP
jgi:hypothetical protein